jgi:hypothetical protein
VAIAWLDHPGGLVRTLDGVHHQQLLEHQPRVWASQVWSDGGRVVMSGFSKCERLDIVKALGVSEFSNYGWSEEHRGLSVSPADSGLGAAPDYVRDWRPEVRRVLAFLVGS